MVMVFTLVSAAQDKLVELMDSIKEMQLEEQRRKEEEIKRQEEVGLFCDLLIRDNTQCVCVHCSKTSPVYPAMRIMLCVNRANV